MVTELNKLLNLVVEKDASDLHMTVGIPPTIRHHGRLKALNLPPLTPEDTVAYKDKLVTAERHKKQLAEKGGCDLAMAFEDKARFRTAVYTQKGHIGIALRLIPSKIRSFEEIGIPGGIKKLLERPRGLILITGPTGCGKTTTLATMIDYINVKSDCHIITIEDPIEYYHSHKKSIITQREIGFDIGSFKDGLTKALRMDPDVVLVGEMRDLETISTAITAAETGHLVFGTLHTTGSARTVNRIIDAFPMEQQEQIRAMLASSLIAVISQMLLPRADMPGRIAAFEIMLLTSAIEHNIRENQTHKIVSAIQTGAKDGMILLDDFLFNLYLAKKIKYEEMLDASQNPKDLETKIKEYAQQRAAVFKKK
ncbi:type IV pilus twitching motility protein PilT [Planctomycetota bacterium]